MTITPKECRLRSARILAQAEETSSQTYKAAFRAMSDEWLEAAATTEAEAKIPTMSSAGRRNRL